MLYTRKGDTGTSGLFGTRDRFPKNSPIYEALGTLDELNSLLGLCRASKAICNGMSPGISGEVLPELLKVQECLFLVQAELAGADKTLTKAHVDELEDTIDYMEKIIVKPNGFVIPGANFTSALCDYARALSRRAERAVINSRNFRTLSESTMAYLNRLSSLLYVLARYSAELENAAEVSPSYRIN